ncbi:MAG TPA: hypothetical protein VK306_15230 [Acidimicrobiales bacterium]|nr:hypothetical protein [Acidimicrobiales bacterium]
MTAGDERSPGQHDLGRSPLDVGTRRRTGEPLPRAGTWEVVDHDGCAGAGTLRAMTAGDEAPRCPSGDHEVTWQLTHLAPSAAAEHRGATPLP